MTAYLLLDHFLNFMAPAFFVALGLALLMRLAGLFFKSKRPSRQPFWAQVAIIFIVNTLVLAAGLAGFGNDGKMLTYAALVLGAALCQWVLSGGHRT